MTSIPDSCKILKPFILRAQELDRSNEENTRIVSYYCVLHAIAEGVKINRRGPEGDKLLSSLLSKLEEEKKSLNLPNQINAKIICTNFAMKKFQEAYDIDMNGLSDKSTAQKFFAVGTLFEILVEFGELSPDCATKKKYAKLKAIDIVTAIEAGKTPKIGLPDKMDPLEFAAVAEPPPSVQQQVESNIAGNNVAEPVKPKSVVKEEPKKLSSQELARRARLQKIDDATEYARFALRALEFKDKKLAKQRLVEALKLLD